MSTENNCPYCGAPLENVIGNACPACGSALPARANSSATIVSQKSDFNNSAEVMDEIKHLINEGDQSAAETVASNEFNLSPEEARSTVEQVVIDMPLTEKAAPAPYYTEATPAEKPIHPDVVLPAQSAPQKPSSSRNWIIGCSVGAAIFLCLCCCLPTIVIIAYSMFSQK